MHLPYHPDTFPGMTAASGPLPQRPASYRLLRALRHLPDRLLHKVRRRTLVARLQREGPPAELLVVCWGNICRSPYAEHRLARRLEGQTRARMAVRSAGFFQPGRPSPDRAQEVARERGVDLSRHLSSGIPGDCATASTLVLVFEERHRQRLVRDFVLPANRIVLLGDLDPMPIDTRRIPDPYGESVAIFTEVYARIDRCLDVLLASWDLS